MNKRKVAKTIFAIIGYITVLLPDFISARAESDIIFARSPGAINTGGTLDLMVYDFDAKTTRLLLKGTVSGRGEYSPTVSPDGSRMIFNTYQFGGWKLGIADYQNGALSGMEKLTDRLNYEYDAVFSPDGKKIAYQEYNWSSDNSDIFVLDLENREADRITEATGSDRTAAWTGNSQSIVFASERSGNFDIYIKKPNGNPPVNLTVDKAIDFAPSVSGANDLIAFLSDRNGQIDLFIMNLNGSGLTNLTATLESDEIKSHSFDNSGYWAYKTSWSPNGRKIAFTLMYGGNLEIFTVNKDGSNLVQITDNNDTDMTPFWADE